MSGVLDKPTGTPLPEDAFELFKAMITECAKTNPYYDQLKAIIAEGAEVENLHNQGSKPAEKWSEQRIRDTFNLMAGTAEGANDYRVLRKCGVSELAFLDDRGEKAVSNLLNHPDLQFVQVIRLLVLLAQIFFHGESRFTDEMFIITYRARDYMEKFAQRHKCRIGLKEVAEACGAIGIDPDLVGWNRLTEYGSTVEFENDPMYLYYGENLHLIRQALGLERMKYKLESWEKGRVRKNALEILQMLPEPPEAFVPIYWDWALGSAKADREFAIKCLNKLPGIKDKVVEALSSSKKDARISAAGWLADLKAKDALPAIRAALEKEKLEPVRIALTNALGALGGAVEVKVDTAGLLKEAQTYLKKGMPEALSWFSFDKMPVLHWEDGTEVPKEIPTYWIVKNNKLNNPAAGAEFIKLCGTLKQEDREALAQYILDAWIARDTEPVHTPYHIDAEAKKYADHVVKALPGWYTYEQAYRSHAQSMGNECKYSAIKEKGILAVAGACGGSRVAPVVEAYLKRWYGWRAAQCKALVRMLSSMDDKGAIHLLLSVATKFRTKGIREEAEASVTALAERKDWTLDELADRTIPTAGFDEGTVMNLDYGSRTFTARLDDNLNIILTDSDGAVIKTLPDARKDDDEEKVKESKWLFSNAKKEVKAVFKTQKERLYEAMCTQRAWNYEDWRTFLLNHPIAGFLCRGLVWTAQDGGKETRFRPLEDGTLTDCQDNEVKLSDSAVIRLAHSVNTPEDEGTEWIKHLKDYEVNPSFEQFTKPLYTLPEDKKNETAIEDFANYALKAFDLRNKATSLGYARGETEEGYFFTYVKRFPGIKLEAVIEFSGNQLPEQNVEVALEVLCFIRKSGDDEKPDVPVKLGEVPPVILSECFCDISLIAAEGRQENK